ncbi:MAG TPA: phosphate ABC transporter ATP-binding protein, partial [Peptococcaceae bacterium]|nr:phosphate ABC transporter ATP-binding protein [Peptococcaceae bacterium]
MTKMLFELNDVIKEYDGVPVLHIENLQFEENKIYAIMGPNGSGKSTLLKLLNL